MNEELCNVKQLIADLCPEMKVTVKVEAKHYFPLDEFHDLRGELKFLSENNKEKLIKSIFKYGFFVPYFAWKSPDGILYIVDAHQRQKVLLELRSLGVSIPKLPAFLIEASDKKEAKEKLLIINSKYGTMTSEGLEAFLNEPNFEIDMDNLKDLLDFPGLDIEDFIYNTENTSNEDTYEVPPVNEIKTDIVRGDLITFSKKGKVLHRLMCGDSTNSDDVALLMNGEKADMVFTDPPYNVKISGLGCHNVKDKNGRRAGIGGMPEFAMASGEMSKEEFMSFLSAVFELLISFSKDGSIHYICMDWKHIYEIINAGQLYTELKNLCVWNKDNGGMGTFYRNKHELIFVFKNGIAPHINTFELGQYGRYRTNVWDYPMSTSFASQTRDENNCSNGNPDSKLHPTVKPLKLVSDAILDCSHEGLLILDLFLGSGTTMVAAHQLNRKCYGMEIDEKYCQVIIDRMKRLDDGLIIEVIKNTQD